ARPEEVAEGGGVGADDPLEVVIREREGGLDGRQRDIHDRDVEHHHELDCAQQNQREPFAIRSFRAHGTPRDWLRYGTVVYQNMISDASERSTTDVGGSAATPTRATAKRGGRPRDHRGDAATARRAGLRADLDRGGCG